MCGVSDLKAFSVTEDGEGSGGVYFARHSITAKKQMMDDMGHDELRGISARRLPWADKYAGQGVPMREMVAIGWWGECHHCGEQINEETMSEAGRHVDGVVGTIGGTIFCDANCETAEAEYQAERKAECAKAVKLMRCIAEKRLGRKLAFFTGGFNEHVYVVKQGGLWSIQQASVGFKFDGQKHGSVALKYDAKYHGGPYGPHQPEFFCPNGDLEAFQAWSSAEQEDRP